MLFPVILILHVCLVGDPATCRDVRPMVTEPLNIFSCQIAAQQLGAQFEAENPKWRVDSLHCMPEQKAREQPI